MLHCPAGPAGMPTSHTKKPQAKKLQAKKPQAKKLQAKYCDGHVSHASHIASMQAVLHELRGVAR